MFYTIQSIEKWELANQLGYLEGDKEYVYEYFLDAYKWMMQQMKTRLRKYNNEYPVWLWPKRPDLRMSSHLPKGTKGILLQVNIPEADVLLSDFDAYHCILNDWFLLVNDKEEELFDKGKLDISKEKSWERIFDLELLKNSEYWGSNCVQGVTGKIMLDNIKVIKEFTAR